MAGKEAARHSGVCGMALRAILSSMTATQATRPETFAGMKVLSLESRRATEIESLIRTYSGEPIVAPAVQEVPLDANAEALKFIQALEAGEFDAVVFLTGVGARILADVAGRAGGREAFVAALSRIQIIARGPKPSGALRELGLAPALRVGEPHTWREVLEAMDGVPALLSLRGMRIAIQEYGAPSLELASALRERGARVVSVPVYRWMLPNDLAPLDAAIRRVLDREIGTALFTAGVQVKHLFVRAAQTGCAETLRAGLARCVLASIGPTTSAALREHGLESDLEASHAKMGFLVKEAAEQAGALLRKKREGVRGA